mmetsp:Transcript_68991/g.194570  ORF Transcript_68991/g.194570 Transcript_68991/m.194570 type:complete len:206 (-) Transcript_68991:203-820(-)
MRVPHGHGRVHVSAAAEGDAASIQHRTRVLGGQRILEPLAVPVDVVQLREVLIVCDAHDGSDQQRDSAPDPERVPVHALHVGAERYQLLAEPHEVGREHSERDEGDRRERAQLSKEQGKRAHGQCEHRPWQEEHQQHCLDRAVLDKLRRPLRICSQGRGIARFAGVVRLPLADADGGGGRCERRAIVVGQPAGDEGFRLVLRRLP